MAAAHLEVDILIDEEGSGVDEVGQLRNVAGDPEADEIDQVAQLWNAVTDGLQYLLTPVTSTSTLSFTKNFYQYCRPLKINSSDQPEPLKISSLNQHTSSNTSTPSQSAQLKTSSPDQPTISTISCPRLPEPLNMAPKPRDPFQNKRTLFGPKSKLIGVDLANYFANPLAWDSLTEDQKTHLRERLPPHVTYDDDGRPSFEFLRYDVNWKSDLRRFQEDLADGKHETEWLLEAKQAMDERAEGKFDEWKLQQFEEHWGQKTEVDNHEYSGVLTDIQVPDLVSHGSFQVGDVWKYSRAFGRGKNGILVEYEAKIVEVDNYGKLKFQLDGSNNADLPEKRSHEEAFAEDDEMNVDAMIVDTPKQPKLEPSNEAISTDESSRGDTVITLSSSEAIANENDARPYNTRGQKTAPARFDPSTPSKAKPQPIFPFTVTTISPKELERKILGADGRYKWNGKGDAWKYFWCKRGDQELGSLWDIREKYWLAKEGKGRTEG